MSKATDAVVHKAYWSPAWVALHKDLMTTYLPAALTMLRNAIALQTSVVQFKEYNGIKDLQPRERMDAIVATVWDLCVENAGQVARELMRNDNGVFNTSVTKPEDKTLVWGVGYIADEDIDENVVKKVEHWALGLPNAYEAFIARTYAPLAENKSLIAFKAIMHDVNFSGVWLNPHRDETWRPAAPEIAAIDSMEKRNTIDFSFYQKDSFYQFSETWVKIYKALQVFIASRDPADDLTTNALASFTSLQKCSYGTLIPSVTAQPWEVRIGESVVTVRFYKNNVCKIKMAPAACAEFIRYMRSHFGATSHLTLAGFIEEFVSERKS
jgi:hypothetical protein